jgi:2-succinyl-5-enolpyruvyl-6-hydroxy-3-cyclohexene-1-carboxylate synthase
MTNYYSSDKATQIVVALLKAHNIRYVIASPGTTNIALVGSMQYDPYFKIYSSADERSAAYMACGLAAETGEPVVITCTEATASRNYLPALTEAYYRKLPILVITGHHGLNKVGHLSSQTIDRSVHPNDTVKLSVSVNTIHTPEDEWRTIVDVNRAILELSHHGNGPVHINLEAGVSAGFHQKELPKFRKIKRVTDKQNMPMMPQGRVAVFIGSHVTFSKREVNAIDQFCSSHDAVVF